MERFCVRIDRDDFFFSAAHFIVLPDGTCEPIHGHDYRVAVELEGPLDASSFVVDFLAVERRLRGVLSRWDHALLLAAQHPELRAMQQGHEMTVTYRSRRWVIPADECRLLPLVSTTSEELARLLGRMLLEGLAADGMAVRPRLRVELTESFGQTAIWEQTTG